MKGQNHGNKYFSALYWSVLICHLQPYSDYPLVPGVESREKFMACFLIMYTTKPFAVHVLPVNRLILVYNFIQFHIFMCL
jgi:hypothetical protein